MHGESDELRDEVIRLARAFGIVTPYTAYLVLEDEQRRGVAQNLRSFQEMEEDQYVRDAAKDRMDSVRREAASEANRAGASAVQNSQALQGLKQLDNLPQAAPAAGLAKKQAGAANANQGYRASQTLNYAQQVRVVGGRAFYQNGSVWTDSTAQLQKGLRQKRVVFGSAEYFALAERSPQAAQWLALGNEVDVVMDGYLVNIR
jgi:Ca-activated chloride channel family protein